MENSPAQSDHDLLIVLHTEVKALRTDIQAMGTSQATRLEDHELRIRIMEKAIWKWSGAAAAVGILGGYIANHVLK